uniref:SHSP domain-containing protein n=1 Tax=Parascaris univalens TaxID=6257 RepID=A0A915AX18_PARUN
MQVMPFKLPSTNSNIIASHHLLTRQSMLHNVTNMIYLHAISYHK